MHLLWNGSESGEWRCPELLWTQSTGLTHSLLWWLAPILGTVKLSFLGRHPFSHVMSHIFLLFFSTVGSGVMRFSAPHRSMSSLSYILILKSIFSWIISFGFNSLSFRTVLTIKRSIGLPLLPLILPVYFLVNIIHVLLKALFWRRPPLIGQLKSFQYTYSLFLMCYGHVITYCLSFSRSYHRHVKPLSFLISVDINPSPFPQSVFSVWS